MGQLEILLSFITDRLGGAFSTLFGNGEQSSFWNDIWLDDVAFKDQYERLFALEDSKLISVASKLGHPSLFYSFRRQPRGGVEQESFNLLSSKVQSVILPRTEDRWSWSLDGA
ncbi:hypothetical protein Tco_0473237, partial [Tanacetum coccineum]